MNTKSSKKTMMLGATDKQTEITALPSEPAKQRVLTVILFIRILLTKMAVRSRQTSMYD